MNLQEVRCGDMDRWLALVNVVMNLRGYIICWELLDKLKTS